MEATLPLKVESHTNSRPKFPAAQRSLSPIPSHTPGDPWVTWSHCIILSEPLTQPSSLSRATSGVFGGSDALIPLKGLCKLWKSSRLKLEGIMITISHAEKNWAASKTGLAFRSWATGSQLHAGAPCQSSGVRKPESRTHSWDTHSWSFCSHSLPTKC